MGAPLLKRLFLAANPCSTAKLTAVLDICCASNVSCMLQLSICSRLYTYD